MIRRPAVAMLMTALITTGCSAAGNDAAPRNPQTTTVAISYDDLLNQKNVTRSVTLAVGDTLQVSLGASPSTGYQWASDMSIANEAVLIQTGYETVAAASDRPGAAGAAIWALQAVGPGTTTVSTTYGRPWEGGEKGAWTFTAEVTVN